MNEHVLNTLLPRGFGDFFVWCHLLVPMVYSIQQICLCDYIGRLYINDIGYAEK